MNDSEKKRPAPVPLAIELPELPELAELSQPLPLAQEPPVQVVAPVEKAENILEANEPEGLFETTEPENENALAVADVQEKQAKAEPRVDLKPTALLQPIASDNMYLNGLRPLHQVEFSEATERYVGANAVGPMKLMASRAMAPLAPRDLLRVVYQLIFDPDDRIAAAAMRSFKSFDERVLSAVLGDQIPSTVLLLLSRTLISKSLHLERVLLNRSAPDESFAHVARHCEDPHILSIVAGNQERMLRDDDIIRGLVRNNTLPRADLDRAIDFLVREGVFLEDVPQFSEAFNRLGKTEIIDAVENIEISHHLLTEEEQLLCAKHGLSAEQLLLGAMRDISTLLEAEDLELHSRRRQPLNTYPISVQIKMAMLGDHLCVLEGLHSANRMVASAAIRNPKVREGDILKIAKIKSISEEVVRYICKSRDWTKSYQVKFSLISHPKNTSQLRKKVDATFERLRRQKSCKK